MNGSQVLILSGVYDFSTDLVCLCLSESDVPFARLNREHLKDYRLAMDPLYPSLSIVGPNIDAEIGPDLVSVWFRQPVFLRNSPETKLPPAEQLERSQWVAFMRAMSVFDKASWMNYPQATYLAECKPYQLLAARRAGFKVPRTIVGNDSKAIRSNFTNNLVIKSLDTVLLIDGADSLFTYTNVSISEDLRDSSVFQAPLLAQELVSPKTDVRVTVVGDEVFAVRILSQGKGIEGDWRIIPKELLDYEDFLLPHEIETSCKRLAAILGLSFAAIDLADTGKEIFFIEVNPTGEWGWLSNNSRRIDQSIASWLSHPPQKC